MGFFYDIKREEPTESDRRCGVSAQECYEIKWTRIVFAIIALIFFFTFVSYPLGYISAKYNVWEQGQEGKAQLAKADWNRQIEVKEADAKASAAVELAKAEVERAQGVAKANKIIGDSLENNHAYLEYLFINNLAHTKNQIIYVPTEAQLPILEAGRSVTSTVKVKV